MSSKKILKRLKDALVTIDVSESIRGHNGRENTKFYCLKESDHMLRVGAGRLECIAVEKLVKDSYGNMYLLHYALMPDDEAYEVVKWIKKSVLEQWGGVLNDALLAMYRNDAAIRFHELKGEISGEIARKRKR